MLISTSHMIHLINKYDILGSTTPLLGSECSSRTTRLVNAHGKLKRRIDGKSTIIHRTIRIVWRWPQAVMICPRISKRLSFIWNSTWTPMRHPKTTIISKVWITKGTLIQGNFTYSASAKICVSCSKITRLTPLNTAQSTKMANAGTGLSLLLTT